MSLLLFALAVEPLVEAIRDYIVGFHRCMGKEMKALYADDALVFLGDTHTSLSAVISLIDTYGTLSGFNINLDKSVILIRYDCSFRTMPTK